MKKNFLSFWLILIASIFFLVLIAGNFQRTESVKKNSVKKSIASQSAQTTFSAAILEAKKKQEDIVAYGPCRWVPILMYHHVGDPPKNWLYVDTKTFTKQMDYLQQKGYTTITLPEVAADLSSGNFPPRPVAITFDDGYRDVFYNAYPVLRDRGLKATFFLITQLMEGADYLTWEEAKEMAHNALMTMGDHTLSHRALASLSEDKIKDEIFSSKRIIEEKLGVSVNVFSYPYGSFNQTVIKNLREAGFAAAVVSSLGNSCAKLPYGLRRIRIGRSSLSTYGL